VNIAHFESLGTLIYNSTEYLTYFVTFSCPSLQWSTAITKEKENQREREGGVTRKRETYPVESQLSNSLSKPLWCFKSHCLNIIAGFITVICILWCSPSLFQRANRRGHTKTITCITHTGSACNVGFMVIQLIS